MSADDHANKANENAFFLHFKAKNTLGFNIKQERSRNLFNTACIQYCKVTSKY